MIFAIYVLLHSGKLLIVGNNLRPQLVPHLLELLQLLLLPHLDEVPQVLVKLLQSNNDGVILLFYPHQVVSIGLGQPLELLHYFGNFGFVDFYVSPHLFLGVVDGDNAMLAVGGGVVHAAGTEHLPADCAVEGKHDVVGQAPLLL